MTFATTNRQTRTLHATKPAFRIATATRNSFATIDAPFAIAFTLTFAIRTITLITKTFSVIPPSGADVPVAVRDATVNRKCAAFWMKPFILVPSGFSQVSVTVS